MKKAKIIQAPSNSKSYFGTTVKNTNLSQRETLEEVIINLATLIGAKEVYKKENSRGAFFTKFKHLASHATKVLQIQYLSCLGY